MLLTKCKDFNGIASADSNKRKELINSLLKNRGVSDEEYEGIGVRLYFSSGKFRFSFICIDKKKSTETDIRHVELELQPNIELKNFDYLFESFSAVVIHGNKFDYSKLEDIESVIIKQENESENATE